MRAWGIAGYSGSGKTTLIGALIPVLADLGLSVSTIKQARRGFDIDQPGKDSFRHRAAGAHEVLVASEERWALLHEVRGGERPTFAQHVAALRPVDIVLVEGFRHEALPRIEVYAATLGKPPLHVSDPLIEAVVTDDAVTTGLPCFGRCDVARIARFLAGITVQPAESAA